MNEQLRDYITKEVLPSYHKNEAGHGLKHIEYVIERSIKFASTIENINLDMVYTIAAYHDIGHYIDSKNHEKVSAEMLLADKNLRDFFTDEQIQTMAEAVEDHRASSTRSEPRSIYGKIVSSADRSTSINTMLCRSYAHSKKHYPNLTFVELIEVTRAHLKNKYSLNGYAVTKMYFKDDDFTKMLNDIDKLVRDPVEYRRLFMVANGIENELKPIFEDYKEKYPEESLDQVLYGVYNLIKDRTNESFDVVRNEILDANGIDELEYYTKNVSKELKDYVEEYIFPEYDKNDGGHNIAHILEVIRRSFALNDTFKLGLNDNMMYAIASCHDWGKYVDHEKHHLIAAENFMNDSFMASFFTDEERQTIKEAIEDHRSSREDEPRSTYGKLISSADRNTRIEIVFIRSFFVAHERMPEMNIEEYLDYTIKRLSKKYDEENPENMFFEDETYKVFIQDMRALLKKEEEFKKRYCAVNHIQSRDNTVQDEQGETAYIKSRKFTNNN